METGQCPTVGFELHLPADLKTLQMRSTQNSWSQTMKCSATCGNNEDPKGKCPAMFRAWTQFQQGKDMIVDSFHIHGPNFQPKLISRHVSKTLMKELEKFDMTSTAAKIHQQLLLNAEQTPEARASIPNVCSIQKGKDNIRQKILKRGNAQAIAILMEDRTHLKKRYFIISKEPYTKAELEAKSFRYLLAQPYIKEMIIRGGMEIIGLDAVFKYATERDMQPWFRTSKTTGNQRNIVWPSQMPKDPREWACGTPTM
eukprot:TRINITY_DN2384_c0_g1_i11.p1 TRINITY_DN2384_c0_g1~~TRINITY_DN2384_c0_g1_i11.p1  ORF type:complete len:256 (-),score=28.27 TRINITY_DN2384_c0_g1_i11:270-1037(-)